MGHTECSQNSSPTNVPSIWGCVAWWPCNTCCTECQCLSTDGGARIRSFLHAMTRLRGAETEREMCSCEGVCISVVVRGFAGKSVPFNYPSGSAVHYGQQVVIVARAWLKYAPVTSLARGRHRDDSLWWRSVWQVDWRSCPAPSNSMLCAVATRFISFSQSRSVAPRINLRNTWMCIGVHFVVFHWLHDYQFSCSRSFFCLHFALGGRRFSDKCTQM